LDRDGTINVYKPLIKRAEDFELIDMAADAIKLINDSGYLCIVVSNQPNVAKNLCTFEDVLNVNNKMQELLFAKGAHLDDIFVCPHHPEKGYKGENTVYKIKCHCRKPDIGMLEEARKKYNIDLRESFIIGDSTVDIQTGKNYGIKTILVKTGLAGRDGKYMVTPDYIACNLYKAVNIVLQNRKG
jgi:histidinol-phosphate phosphatase family protein